MCVFTDLSGTSSQFNTPPLVSQSASHSETDGHKTQHNPNIQELYDGDVGGEITKVY